MSTNKRMDILCLMAGLFALALTVSCLVFISPDTRAVAMGYEARLFDTSTVHTIDIIMDDWQSFIDTCTSEEYSLCSVVIDGVSFRNVGIRGKGNTSLSSVSSMASNRYSFKLEFDQYAAGGNYYGLDKLSLNNLIYDNTMMKDYLVYQMMNEFDAAAPLCSFVYITVNGEDFGLYLAVEGVEDSFLQRNYGYDHGELYKPDSMNFGGGRGNGRDFRMENFMAERGEQENFAPPAIDPVFPEKFDPAARGSRPDTDQFESSQANKDIPPSDYQSEQRQPNIPGGGGFGMGSEDVKLQYIDDNISSYSGIFDSAKTDITEADQTRLIASLKTLSEGSVIESAVNVEDAIRYFVVHNYAVNGDSYTGSMIHNYYLYEEAGKLSMLPWDYNLAFGTFQGSSSESSINDPIDTPMNTGSSDRPMIDWILENEEYLALYHEYFAQFLKTVDIQAIIDHAAEIIAPYVKKDPTRFCTYEEFRTGVETLKAFCFMRSESIQGQLEGTIPSTAESQNADASSLIQADLKTSDMGSMGGGMGGAFNAGRSETRPGGSNTAVQAGQFPSDSAAAFEETTASMDAVVSDFPPMPAASDISSEFNVPGNIQQPQVQRPENFTPDLPQGRTDAGSWILIVSCILATITGLIFAARYKRRR